MSDRIQSFLTIVSSWTRALQWAFWAAVFTIAFLIWHSTISAQGEIWAEQSKTIENQIEEVNRPTMLTNSVRTAITTFGNVELPRTDTLGATAMTGAIHEILGSHAVKDDDYTRTKSSKMRSGSLPGIARPGQQIEQIIGDIHFEAIQEDVMEVIAALESSEWIDALSNVRLTKQTGRMIRVDLSVEAWVVTTKKKRGRR